jgi:ATP-dependent DNA helicase RecQ
MTSPASTYSLPDLQGIIERHWGFRSLRPLQERAMQAVLEGRDSLLVLPTGGGKSLCYQAPAVLRGSTTVVISPLIALMKDQVDSLQACGIPAIQLDSSQSSEDRFCHEMDVREGKIRLLFVSPERLMMSDFTNLLRGIQVNTFAIDEAHCISHWGHDFRPEYRQMRRIRELFPQASVHAYTATATEKVRADICAQLKLREPEVLVGNFDRPNLTYRMLARAQSVKQALLVIERHQGEAGIIYCLRRRDVDELTTALQQQGIAALPYHAGMTAEERSDTQNAFASEKCDLIVATVAFGMGINRSNLRFILHTALPKSIEHYQQETGRAGRDGLEAECVLLYSAADFLLWKSIAEKSAAEANAEPAFLANSLAHLNDMDRYCRGAVCRHRALVEYFGQEYPRDNCGACDLCLGDTEILSDGVVIAQKILSCVARVREGFGINHVISILRGDGENERVQKYRHDKLSTFALLRDSTAKEIRDWIYQLISQGVLRQDGDEFPVLKLNEDSWEVMRNQRGVRLLRPVKRKRGERLKRSQSEDISWEGVDNELFEVLRRLRRQLAEASQKPAYVIFGDRTLRELAKLRPSTSERMRNVYGVGDNKLREFGEAFLTALRDHCRETGLRMDVQY